ncbi:hypothetical protein MAR_018916 [Mya arenaria]|uniref:Uncharacterized protein n=2 Tax=Mya arenaria TaxID=6604 RepID=A0ABY7EG23_MYAAR|nr:hypothetical protein MAR_018916 [Mya arenaria]
MILKLIYLLSITFFTALGDEEFSMKELEMTIKLIEHDINGMKRKVWIELPDKLHRLEKELSNRSFVDNNQNVYNYSAGNCDSSVKTLQNIDNLHGRLTKAFEAEKFRAKITEIKLEQLESTLKEYLENVERINANSLKIRVLEEDISKIERSDRNQSQIIQALQLRLKEIHGKMISFDAWKGIQVVSNDNITKLLADLSYTIDSVKSSVEQLERMNFKQSYKPSFISKWYLMKALDEQLSHLTIEHGLGVLPYKVEVQIRPVSGPNSGWVFKGDSAIRSDDDLNKKYGGIVYFYNEEKVELIAPVKGNNNRDIGVIINTGQEDGRRLGNNHDAVNQAFVRVKIWAPRDLPTPDFQSEWLPMDIEDPAKTYQEIEHSLDGYPGLLSVQIKCESPKSYLISDGTGAASIHTREYDNTGGTVWSYNDKYVRMWVGHDLRDKYEYRLFGGVPDGWFDMLTGFDTARGKVRVLAWKTTTFGNGNLESVSDDTVVFPEWQPFKAIDYERDFVSLFVEANEGPNKGFRFPASGSSQAKTSPFGGVVFAYETCGKFRMWRPSPDIDGFLIHVPRFYGNGVHSQATNNASYVAVLLKT